VAEALGQLLRLHLQVEGAAKVADAGHDAHEVEQAVAGLQGIDSVGDRDALLQVVEPLPVTAVRSGDAEPVERGGPELLQTELLGHRERLPTDSHRPLGLAGEHEEA
jgi:hypothetical protein